MMNANAITAVRHPMRETSQVVPGRNAVLASPPITVIVAIARNRSFASA